MAARPAALALIFALAACSGSPAGPKNPDTFVHLDINDVDSFDPAWANDVGSQHPLMHVYEPLLAYKGSSLDELEPLIASAVPSAENGLVSKDRKTYRFPIREGVRFHDGSELTPEDVKYSLMRFCLFDRDGGPSSQLLEPLLGLTSTRESGKAIAGLFARLDRAIRVDGGDVVVTLQEPFAPFLSALAVWGAVVSKPWSAALGDWDGSEAAWKRHSNPRRGDSPLHGRANGTGPFKLERWSPEAREVHLVRHDGYWRGPARLKRVVIRSVPEWTTRRLMLAAGDADSVYAERPAVAELMSLPGVSVFDDLPVLQANPVVFFNFRAEPAANPDIGSGRLDGNGIPPDFFSDPDVRKGFAFALDYDAFLRDAAGGKGTRAGGVIPPGLLGHDPKLPPYALDPRQAESHFRKAWGGRAWEKGFRVTIAYNAGNAPREVLARLIKRGVESVNPRFRVETRPLEWASYLGAMNAKRLPLFIMGWSASYPDPHDFAFPFLHSHGTYPIRQNFKDAPLDRLVVAARREPDPARRRELYLEAQRRAHDLAHQLPVAFPAAFRVQRSWVKGWVHRPIFPGSPRAAYLYPLRKE